MIQSSLNVFPIICLRLIQVNTAVAIGSIGCHKSTAPQVGGLLWIFSGCPSRPTFPCLQMCAKYFATTASSRNEISFG